MSRKYIPGAPVTPASVWPFYAAIALVALCVLTMLAGGSCEPRPARGEEHHAS